MNTSVISKKEHDSKEILYISFNKPKTIRIQCHQHMTSMVNGGVECHGEGGGSCSHDNEGLVDGISATTARPNAT